MHAGIWSTSWRYTSYWNAFLLLPANEVWGKVIFLNLSVILFRGGGVLSQYALQVVSQHALQQVSRGSGIPACLAGFQAHTQGGSLGVSGWGGLQANTQGGSWGGSGPGPQPRGKLRGVCSRGGCLLGGVCETPPTATAAGGTHPTGMHSCKICFYTSNLNTMIKVDTNYLINFMDNQDPFTSSESENYFDVCHFVWCFSLSLDVRTSFTLPVFKVWAFVWRAEEQRMLHSVVNK